MKLDNTCIGSSRFGLRFISQKDCVQVLQIYAPYITDSIVTFEYDVPSIDDFTERVKGIARTYPFIGLFDGDILVGYAYAARHLERAAYQWNALLSVYVRDEYMRCGAGSVLYNALIEILKLQNIHNIYGLITVPNDRSEVFHKKLGFVKVGLFPQSGFKFEKWYDVVWYHKRITEIQKPDELLPITNIKEECINDIFENSLKLLKISCY